MAERRKFPSLAGELAADAPVGASYAAWAGLDDPVIEINLTPNRPDAAGVAGIARDLAAAGLGLLKTADPAPVEGRFDRWKADILFGPKALDRSRVTVTIDMASAKTGDPQRDASLPAPDWFDSANHPSAVFTASRFTESGEGRYVAHGTLTLRGVTKPLALPFQLKIEGPKATVSARASLDRIAVTYGPGTFTGTRICVSAARALALATGAEIVAISSMRLMALSPLIPAAPTARVAIATDARRGEVYIEVFDRHTSRSVVAAQCAGVEEAAKLLGASPIVIAGSGAEDVADAAHRMGIDATAILPGLLPDAFAMLFAAEELAVSASVSPLYLRPPDAKPPAPSPLLGAGA